MIKLMQTREVIKVICDQTGTPTWTNGLAEFIWFLAEENNIKGIYHWTDAGIASWYDFAVAIQEEALLLNILDKPVSIIPVNTEAYPTPARRPQYSVMDKTESWNIYNKKIMHWRSCLREMLMQYKDQMDHIRH